MPILHFVELEIDLSEKEGGNVTIRNIALVDIQACFSKSDSSNKEYLRLMKIKENKLGLSWAKLSPSWTK